MLTTEQIDKFFEALHNGGEDGIYVIKVGFEVWCNDRYRFEELEIGNGKQYILDADEGRRLEVTPEAEFKFYKITRTLVAG